VLQRRFGIASTEGRSGKENQASMTNTERSARVWPLRSTATISNIDMQIAKHEAISYPEPEGLSHTQASRAICLCAETPKNQKARERMAALPSFGYCDLQLVEPLISALACFSAFFFSALAFACGLRS
jgi:hypothetical protein